MNSMVNKIGISDATNAQKSNVVEVQSTKRSKSDTMHIRTERTLQYIEDMAGQDFNVHRTHNTAVPSEDAEMRNWKRDRGFHRVEYDPKKKNYIAVQASPLISVANYGLNYDRRIHTSKNLRDAHYGMKGSGANPSADQRGPDNGIKLPDSSVPAKNPMGLWRYSKLNLFEDDDSFVRHKKEDIIQFNAKVKSDKKFNKTKFGTRSKDLEKSGAADELSTSHGSAITLVPTSGSPEGEAEIEGSIALSFGNSKLPSIGSKLEDDVNSIQGNKQKFNSLDQYIRKYEQFHISDTAISDILSESVLSCLSNISMGREMPGDKKHSGKNEKTPMGLPQTFF